MQKLHDEQHIKFKIKTGPVDSSLVCVAAALQPRAVLLCSASI